MDNDFPEFHEAAVKLVRDMMDAMLAEKSWGDALDLHARVNALLTSPAPAPTAGAQPIITFDDGARVILDAWTGGKHEAGSFGEITLRFVDEHGNATVREYRAKDAAAQPSEAAREPVAWMREYMQYPDSPEDAPGYPVTSFHQNAEFARLYPGENIALYAAPQPVQTERAMTYPAEFTDDLHWILGLMCFQCIQYAQTLRKAGRDIPAKAEAEQAATIDWMLRHYLADPNNWRKTAVAEMRAMAAGAQPASGVAK